MSGVSGLGDSRTLISSLLFAPILRRMNSRIGESKVAGTSPLIPEYFRSLKQRFHLRDTRIIGSIAFFVDREMRDKRHEVKFLIVGCTIF